ncbi:MAG: hypothetical protein IT566_03815 [Rhodospirillaceae bacterium]|nr:hypothetical protein [Rhodospirillaceae bacterium]
MAVKSSTAYALIASASASGQQFVPGVTLPRAFSYEGVEAIIENGVSRDILKAGMASLIGNTNPAAEAFCLSEQNIVVLSGLVGREALVKRGLL